MLVNQRNATCPVGMIARLIINVAIGYELFYTFMIGCYRLDARKAHQLFTADLKMIARLIRAAIKHGHIEADMGWQQTIIVCRLAEKQVRLDR